MGETARTVAMMVSNPALSSILAMTLAASPFLKVRPFENRLALATYLRLAPIDLLVCDFDSEGMRAETLGEELRQLAAQRKFQIIALASGMTAESKIAAIRAGIDEVILKPMSPRYVLERVVSRLTWCAAPASKPLREIRAASRLAAGNWTRFGDNIVPLFGRDPQPQH